MSYFTPNADGANLIAVNGNNTVLASGDTAGNVKLYNISEYCTEGQFSKQAFYYWAALSLSFRRISILC